MTEEEPGLLVSACYDRLAERWDGWAAAVWPPLREEYLRRLVELLPQGADVLELGCATGEPAGRLLAEWGNYRGVDISAEMIAIARRQVPGGHFAVGDMRTLQVPDASLDAVVAFYSIVHLRRADHAALFAAIHRWIRPGGWFLATLHSRDEEAWLEPDWLGGGPMYWSGFDAATNAELLADAGFEPVTWEVRTQTERGAGGDDEVNFQFVLAQRA